MLKKEEVLGTVNGIFQDVFEDNSLQINLATHAGDIEDWDSFNHVNLIVNIENEYSIKFDLKELQDLKCVEDIIDLIIKKRQ